LFISIFLLSCAASQTTQQTNSTSKDPYANKVTRVKNVKTSHFFSKNDSVWFEKKYKLVPLEAETGYVEASIGQAFKQAFLFSFTNKFAILANDTKSFDVIKSKHPIFYVKSKPTETGIARLTVQADRGRRYIWLVNRVGSNQAHFHPPEDSIAFEWAKTQKGVYKLTVKDSLAPGEYAIISPNQSRKGYDLYSFRIES
jgi:hypothetical protein